MPDRSAGDPPSVNIRTVAPDRPAAIYGLLTDLPLGYSREFTETSEGTYWHLFYNQERVNGGLARNYAFAVSASYSAACAYGHSRVRAQHAIEEPW